MVTVLQVPGKESGAKWVSANELRSKEVKWSKGRVFVRGRKVHIS